MLFVMVRTPFEKLDILILTKLSSSVKEFLIIFSKNLVVRINHAVIHDRNLGDHHYLVQVVDDVFDIGVLLLNLAQVFPLLVLSPVKLTLIKTKTQFFWLFVKSC